LTSTVRASFQAQIILFAQFHFPPHDTAVSIGIGAFLGFYLNSLYFSSVSSLTEEDYIITCMHSK